MKIKKNISRFVTLVFIGITSLAVTGQEVKYKANVPDKIKTPDIVESKRLGTLNFIDGVPSDETVEKLYDNLDFYRGVEAFMLAVPLASMYGYLEGMKEAGMDTYSLGIHKDMFDARSLWLTPNTTTLYGIAQINVTDGPTVLEVPSGVLGPVMDAYFRFVSDVGFTGPDQGQGGKYLFVHEGYEGDLPEDGYHIVKTPTYRNGLLMRAFVIDSDIPKTVAHVEANWKLYPYNKVSNVPEQHFVDLTGKQYNTIHANNFEFYEELDAAVQLEEQGTFGTELTALFSAIGIEKGKAFNPDSRMKEILVDAAAVGNATARAVSYKPRDRRLYFYKDRQWFSPYAPGSHEFKDENRNLISDWRTFFHYVAIGVTPAMAQTQVGRGSSYTFTAQDENGQTLTGDKVYSITLPGPIPAKDFWSFTVYSNQHRSLLETNQKAAGIDSFQEGLKSNKDGSYTVYFSAEPPKGWKKNWVQTMPGKSFSCIMRLYGPLEPWFDKTWRPGDFKVEK